LSHYHDTSLNVLGLLDPGIELNPIERTAIEQANRQIGVGFDNVLFWNLRYSRFRERGSGFGSRGENLAYKRDLLKREGVEDAASVLDFGCGDLEVVKVLNLKSYVGIDSSESALDLARTARPDWTFQRMTIGNDDAAILPPQDFVLCFEVLIHQPSSEAYHRVVKRLADCTLRTLLVSGYDHDRDVSSSNHMVFFYEPLEVSLQRTGRFSTVRRIGAHTSVSIFRCDV